MSIVVTNYVYDYYGFFTLHNIITFHITQPIKAQYQKQNDIITALIRNVAEKQPNPHKLNTGSVAVVYV